MTDLFKQHLKFLDFGIAAVNTDFSPRQTEGSIVLSTPYSALESAPLVLGNQTRPVTSDFTRDDLPALKTTRKP